MTGAAVGEVREVPGPESQALLSQARRTESQASIYPVFFGAGIYAPVMRSQAGLYLEDVDGNVFLDAIGGMACAIQGYRPDRITSAVTTALQELSFLPEMLSEARIDLSAELLKIAPGELREGKVHFEVSGSAANELALEIAFTYLRAMGRSGCKVLSFEGAYHGRLLATTAIGGIASYRERFSVNIPHVTAPFPYAYRCPLGGDESDCLERCLAELERLLAESVDPITGESDIGVVISEPFQSHVTRIPPLDFYRRLRELCDQYEIVFIDDEVVGFGHTGRWFACEHAGVVPDIVTIGKSLSGGLYPISAVIMSRKIADQWEMRPDMHLSTYMGHPVACAAALANLRSIQELDLISGSEDLGRYMLARLGELQDSHRLVGYCDGWGLWLEAELVRSRKTKEPATREAIALQLECVRRGLIIDRSYERSALYLIPPLNVKREEIDLIIDILDTALGVVETENSHKDAML